MNVVRLSPRASAYSLAIAAALALISKTDVFAQVSYTVPGVNYLQDFNTLPLSPENASLQATVPWTDNSVSSSSQTSILGWYLYHPIVQATEGGANQHQRLRAGPGSSTTGSFYSFGTTASSDRALGSLASATMAADGDFMHFALRLNNNTGLTLTDFTVSYNGEQWRNGGTGNANVLNFAYSTTATTGDFFSTATFTPVAALNFTAPVASLTAAAVDGNNAGRVNGITATISGISWAPGSDLWLRWSDVSNPGADDGIGIDDLTFSAIQVIPEPSGFALAGLGIATLFIFRRRK
jgi:PEP-CTERM motif